MIVTLKTLQQQTFSCELEASHTIADLKSQVQRSQGFEEQHQKLIFKGKILADAVVVGDLGITEQDFVVCMVTKPKATASAPLPKVVQPASPKKSSPVAAAATVPAAATASIPAAVPSSFATGPEYESAVTNLTEMGFPRDQIVLAMRAAFNNPDRAAEYLMTGIPDSAREAPAPQAVPTPAAASVAAPVANAPNAPGQYVNLFDAGAQQTRPAAPTATAGDTSLEFLRNSPQFQQLRQLVQTQPQLLQPMLQQLGESDPQLLQLISANQDQFLSMLNDGGDMSGLLAAAGGAAGAEEGHEGGGDQYITITPEEDVAINRVFLAYQLIALGFARNICIEAFLACDKNEEMAANYLFDNGGDDWQ